MKISFTKEELLALSYTIGNGYGDGDVFEEGMLDTKKQQKALISGWNKIKNAIREGQ